MASCIGCLLGCMFILSALLKGTTALTTYDIEWTYPANYSSLTISAGDTIAFNVTSGHSIGEFSKADYDSCSNKYNSIVAKGPVLARYTLNTTGEHYFFCSMDDYCEKNMKMTVNVVGSPTSAPPNSAPALLTGGGLSLLLLSAVTAFLY